MKSVRGKQARRVWVVSANMVIRAGLESLFVRHHWDVRTYDGLPNRPVRRPDSCPDLVVYDCPPSRWKSGGAQFWSKHFCLHVPVVLYYDRPGRQAKAQTTLNGLLSESAFMGIINRTLEGVDRSQKNRLPSPRKVRERDPLSPRERQVYTRLGMALSNMRVASELNVSVKTVETHVENIKRKLKCDSAATLREIAVADRLAGRDVEIQEIS